jgi:hypothetical protein
VSQIKADPPDGQWYEDPAALDDGRDDPAYARALYGSQVHQYSRQVDHGSQVHAGPGTGLGYVDPYSDRAYARPLYGDAAHADPDITDPNLTDSAYARALHAQPVHPYDGPGTGLARPEYGSDPHLPGPGDTDLAYLRSLSTTTPPGPDPAYANPDSTDPFYGERNGVDLAYLGHDQPGAVLAPRTDDGQDGYAYHDDGRYDGRYDGSPYDRSRYDDGRYADGRYADDGGGTPGYDAEEHDLFEDEPGEPTVDPRSLPMRRLHRLDSSRAASRRGTSLVNGVTMTLAAGIGVATLVAVMAALTGHGLTTRQLFFMTHSACGIIIVHAFGGGLTTLVMTKETRLKELIRKWSVAVMAVVAWITVLVGTWLGYAGYRAKPRPGVLNLNAYPQQFLLAHKELAFWDTFAMEWKVNSGWITPFLATAVAFVVLRYHRLLLNDLRLRKLLTNLFVIAFAAALLGSMLGAVINVVAPNDFMHRPWQP